ncbi:class I SAM-dependent methyltransferase [Flavobacteriaceae bacterium]|nr:class I SAM-dependent methyltransferase [Flavobacteriaceae bacterium]
MLDILKSYIIFYLKSTNQHGVHSPFVYDFLCNGIYKKVTSKQLGNWQNYRKHLKGISHKVPNYNIGAKSRIIKGSDSRINKIAKIAGSSRRKASLLIKIIQYFNSHKVLELGTNVGLGTYALKLGSPESVIMTIEGNTELSNFSQGQFEKLKLKDINVLNNEFSEGLKKLDKESFDLIFIDGNHQYESTLKYFNWALGHLNENGLIIFDDIYWSNQMTQAWEEILNDDRIHLSIDFFNLGIIMKRPKQRKQHFILRA